MSQRLVRRTSARALLLLASSFAGLAAAACGAGAGAGEDAATATATQDCTALQALYQRCALDENVDLNACIAANAAEPAACRAASHAYVNCVVKLTCQVVTDPNAEVCVAEAENLNLSCPSEDQNATTSSGSNAGTSRRAVGGTRARLLRRLAG